MKKLLTLVLMTVVCMGLLMCTAQADWSDFVGFWNMQNVAVDGYTIGGTQLDFTVKAAVHSDGVFILIIDNEMSAGYINGFGGNYYIGEGEDAINLSSDSQGRMHLTFYNDDGSKLDYRMRRTTAERVNSRFSSYLGDWQTTAASTAQNGEYTMTLYNDGFGVIHSTEGMMAVRMGTQAGRFALVDNEGLMMPVTTDAQGNISFTIIYTDSGYQATVTMERAY